jgi:hypothetical protein
MNTGLQDAYNLGWKLALVVNGQASAALLDSYESERVPVAQRLLQTTDRLFKLLVSDSWMAGLFRTRILARLAARAMTVERVRALAFRSISQIGIRYRGSPLSQTLDAMPKDAPMAGDRFPWLMLKLDAAGSAEDLFSRFDDRRFTLLVIGQPVPAAASLARNDLLRVLAIPDDPVNRTALDRVGIGAQAFYLVRPDGHIGLAGTRLSAAAVDAYFAEHGLGARRVRREEATADQPRDVQLGRFRTNSTNSSAGNGLLTQ